MALKKIKPTTPGQRHKIVVTNDDITATKPEKSLTYGVRKSGGRNNQGKMTMRYIGGGHKKLYRFIDFKREKDGIPAVVKTIEYDPTVPLVLHSYAMLTVKSVISLLLRVFKLVRPLCLVKVLLLK